MNVKHMFKRKKSLWPAARRRIRYTNIKWPRLQFTIHIVPPGNRAAHHASNTRRSQDRRNELRMHLTFRFGLISPHHRRLLCPNGPLCGTDVFCSHSLSIAHLNFIYLFLIRFNAAMNVCSQRIFSLSQMLIRYPCYYYDMNAGNKWLKIFAWARRVYDYTYLCSDLFSLCSNREDNEACATRGARIAYIVDFVILDYLRVLVAIYV